MHTHTYKHAHTHTTDKHTHTHMQAHTQHTHTNTNTITYAHILYGGSVTIYATAPFFFSFSCFWSELPWAAWYTQNLHRDGSNFMGTSQTVLWPLWWIFKTYCVKLKSHIHSHITRAQMQRIAIQLPLLSTKDSAGDEVFHKDSYDDAARHPA